MANPWPKWLWKKYRVVTSPSALTDWLACPRRWWFKKVVKLPEIEAQHKFVFGNVLHAVIERWMLADSTGRIPRELGDILLIDDEHVLAGQVPGDPVNLYPDGWDKDISKADAQLIKVQVAKAIDEGILRRQPGRQIEEPMIREITPEVAMIGKLDVSSVEGVEDHKSTKSRRYVMTPDDLAADDKMLCYAMEKVLREETDGEQIPLRLNYFSKDPSDPFVRPVEVSVPQADVEQWWEETVVTSAEGMVALKKRGLPAEEWAKVDGPTKRTACRDYGGCPFAEVCGRVKSVEAYRRTIDRLNEPKPSPSSKGPKTMSIFDKKKSRPGGTPKASKPAPPADPTPEPESPPPTPWAVDGCRACGGTGISSKNGPCGACDKIRQRRNETTSADFLINHDDEGNLVWREKGGDAEGSVQVVEEPKVSKPKAARATGKPKSRKPKAAKPEPAPEPEPPAEPEVTEDEAVAASVAEFDETVSEDDDIVGPVLYINAMPQNGEYTPFADLFERESRELAEAAGVESFYDLDSWQRKSDLAKHAETVAKANDREAIVAVGVSSQDMKSYLDALLPYAAEVIRGVF